MTTGHPTMPMTSLRARSVGALTLSSLALVLTLSACRGETSPEPQIVPIRNMYTQPRYNPQQPSPFFADHRTMRPAVDGAVAREMDPDIEITTGRTADDADWIPRVPEPVIRRHGGMEPFLTRGQDRFNIYCSPCHGLSGDGEGVVALRAVSLGNDTLKPPSFHQARLQHIPDGQLYAAITHGIRNMPAYGHNVPLDDRWAIVAYVRALQMSQAHRAPEANP